MNFSSSLAISISISSQIANSLLFFFPPLFFIRLIGNSWLDRFLEDSCVYVSMHESERKYIKVERISFYKLNFEVGPEIKFKGVARSCIVMDYKAWNNGTEQFQYCLKIYWERCRPMLSDHLLARSTRGISLSPFSKGRWTMFEGSLKFYQKGERRMDDWNTNVDESRVTYIFNAFLLYASYLFLVWTIMRI